MISHPEPATIGFISADELMMTSGSFNVTDQAENKEPADFW